MSKGQHLVGKRLHGSRYVMSVNLAKGGNVSLTKEAGPQGLGKSVVGCGWDASSGGRTFDLDLVVAGLDANDKLLNDDWFVYYGHKKAPGKVIHHSGDNLTGAGDGDDEQVTFDFENIPANVVKLLIAVNIYNASSKGGQTFGNVRNAFVRVFDKQSGTEYTRFDLGNDFSTESLVIFGELYRYGDEWKFRAIGQGYDQKAFRKQYGIESF